MSIALHQTFSPTHHHSTRHIVSFISFKYISLLLEHRFAFGGDKRRERNKNNNNHTNKTNIQAFVKQDYQTNMPKWNKRTFEHDITGREISPTGMGTPWTMLCINFNFKLYFCVPRAYICLGELRNWSKPEQPTQLFEAWLINQTRPTDTNSLRAWYQRHRHSSQRSKLLLFYHHQYKWVEPQMLIVCRLT